jgi:hypothetical protein
MQSIFGMVSDGEIAEILQNLNIGRKRTIYATLTEDLIWGVCILLRVWYRMIWVLIRLRNFDIIW